MSFCSNCGAPIEEGQRFCANCGTPVAAPITRENTQPEQEAVNPEAASQQENINPENAFQTENEQPENFAQQENPQPETQQVMIPQPVSGKFPIRKRSLATCIILSLITCGIYGLYWYYCLIEDMRTVTGEQEDMSPAMTVFVTVITCGVYGWIWLYRAGDKIDKLRQARGESSSSLAIIYALLAVMALSIVDYCLIQDEFNKLAED